MAEQSTSVAEKKQSPFRQGYIVFAVLMVLTLIEFFLGYEEFIRPIVGPNVSMFIPLLLIMILKAAIIVYYFMHIYKLWSNGEGQH